MKKIFILFILAGTAVAVACSSGSDSNKSSTTTTTTTTTTTESKSADAEDYRSNPAYAAGKAVENQNDCAGCHKPTLKVIGPSYKEIANKYSASDAPMLTESIVNGSKGKWGDIPMTPHAGLSKEDANTLINYILLFKD